MDKVLKAVKAGRSFNLFPESEIAHIGLKDAGSVVAVDGHLYPLFMGTTFEESQKVDHLLDMRGDMSIEACAPSTADIEAAWKSLEDVPFSEGPDYEMYLDETWNHFPAGTAREEIWRWFDDLYPKGVHALMFPHEDGGERNETMTVKVPMTYTLFGMAEIEVPASLKSVQEVLSYIEQNFADVPLPSNGQYIDDSSELDRDGFPWCNIPLVQRMEKEKEQAGQDLLPEKESAGLAAEVRDMQAARGALEQTPVLQPEKGAR